MRRLFVLFALALLGLAATAQTKQIRNLKSQNERLQKQLKESEKLLNTTKKDVGAQLNNLAVLNTQVQEQQRYVDDIESEVAGLGSNLAALEKELAVLQRDLAECKRRYGRAMLYMFRNRVTQNKWMFILSAKNFRQMFRRMRYVAEYGKFQQMQAAMIRQKEEAVKQKKDEILGIKRQKDELLAEGKQQQSALKEKKTQQQSVVDDLNRRQAELQKNIEKQRRQQVQLTARIDQLVQQEIAAAERRRKEEARRKEAQRKKEAAQRAERERRQKEEARRKAEAEKKKAAQAAAKKKNTTAGKQKNTAPAKTTRTKTTQTARAEEKKRDAEPTFREADNTDRRISGGFAANRGRLPMPITGSYAITAHYGNYNVSGLRGVTLDNKGINITGQAGAQARAVYEGEVTAIFTIAGLHNVIVRHGNYMSVYCNLSSVSVRRGQTVRARQTLGAVARDPSGNYTLHFQLRQETTRLNPESWLGR